jgi:hypothetical protein
MAMSQGDGSDAAIDLGPAGSEDLRWVVEVLWGGVPGVGVRLGPPPPGTDVLADLRIVPHARRPRLLVPADTTAGRGALSAGAATRGRRARAGRAAVAGVYRGPLARAVFRDRLVVYARGGRPETLGDRLAAMLGTQVVLAVNVRPPSPARKPVLQVLDREGRVVAFAKVAWHGFSDASVTTEATFLDAIAAAGEQVRAPEPIGRTTWRGHPVLLTEPMPERIRRWSPGAPPPDPARTRDVASLFGLVTAALARSPAQTRLRARLDEVVGPAPAGSIPRALIALVEGLDRRGDTEVATGTWHGDWSPWNLGTLGDELWAWDWEYAGGDVPLGLDLVHFAFQQAFVGERRDLTAAVKHARTAAEAGLASLGLDAEVRAVTHAVHLAEITLRYLASGASGVAPPVRFSSQAAPVLRAELDRLR